MVSSAPKVLQKAHFSSVEAAAITLAPACLAIWMADMPTPPAAPSMALMPPQCAWPSTMMWSTFRSRTAYSIAAPAPS